MARLTTVPVLVALAVGGVIEQIGALGHRTLSPEAR
jgi:hypothetical protein